MSAPENSNSKAPPSLLSDKAKGADGNGSRILANLEGRVAPPNDKPRRSRTPLALVALLVIAAGDGARGTCNNARLRSRSPEPCPRVGPTSPGPPYRPPLQAQPFRSPRMRKRPRRHRRKRRRSSPMTATAKPRLLLHRRPRVSRTTACRGRLLTARCRVALQPRLLRSHRSRARPQRRQRLRRRRSTTRVQRPLRAEASTRPRRTARRKP